jgi:hypothetical protein
MAWLPLTGRQTTRAGSRPAILVIRARGGRVQAPHNALVGHSVLDPRFFAFAVEANGVALAERHLVAPRTPARRVARRVVARSEPRASPTTPGVAT